MQLSINDYYNLYLGGELVTSNEYYLWRQINEEEAGGAYQRRLMRASYPNFQSKIIDIYRGYVFWGSPKKEGESPLMLAKLGSEILTHSLVGGCCYVLTLLEGPKVYPAYLVRTNKDGSVEISLTGKVDLGTSTSKIIITPERVDEDDHGQPVVASGRVVTWVDGVVTNDEPFTEGQLKKCKWDDTGLSFLRDSAQLNVQIYNLQSVLDTLSLHAGIFITSGASIGDVKKIVPYMHVAVTQGEPPVEFKAPPTAQLKDVRAEIDRRIGIMAAIVGLTQEFSEEIKIEAGEARKWRMLDTNASVMQMAINTAESVNFIEQVHADITGRSAATLQLQPMLNPSGDFDNLAKLDNLIRDPGLAQVAPDVIKAAYLEKVKIVFSDMPEAARAALLAAIESGDFSNPPRLEMALQGAM